MLLLKEVSRPSRSTRTGSFHSSRSSSGAESPSPEARPRPRCTRRPRIRCTRPPQRAQRPGGLSAKTCDPSESVRIPGRPANTRTSAANIGPDNPPDVRQRSADIDQAPAGAPAKRIATFAKPCVDCADYAALSYTILQTCDALSTVYHLPYSARCVPYAIRHVLCATCRTLCTHLRIHVCMCEHPPCSDPFIRIEAV